MAETTGSSPDPDFRQKLQGKKFLLGIRVGPQHVRNRKDFTIPAPNWFVKARHVAIDVPDA